MEIIDITECDLITMYCNISDKKGLYNNDNEYVLTTKTLVSLKDGKTSYIPEVSKELKDKIIREYFNIPYVKDIEEKRRFDLEHNLDIFSTSINTDIQEFQIKFEEYIKDSKQSYILCIQNIPIDQYDVLKDNFKVNRISNDKAKSIMILYNEKDVKILLGDKKIENIECHNENVDILCQTFLLKNVNSEELITLVNINVKKTNTRVKDINLKKNLHELFVELIHKSKFINDIDILSHNLVICGNFNNRNFKIILENMFKDILEYFNKLIQIDEKDKYNSIKYVCDLSNNPLCLSFVNESKNESESKLEKAGKMLGIPHNKSNKVGMFVSDNFKLIDADIKNLDSDEDSTKNILLKLKSNVINRNNIKLTNFFLSFKEESLLMKKISIYKKEVSFGIPPEFKKTNSYQNIKSSIYDDNNSIGYFELSDEDIKQLSDHSGLSAVNIFGNIYKDGDYQKILDYICQGDILFSKFDSYRFLLNLQYHYFKHYGYIDVDFYDNFKYIFNKKSKQIKIIMLNKLVYKLEFNFNKLKTCIDDLLKCLLDKSDDKEISSLLQFSYYILSQAKIEKNTDYNFLKLFKTYFKEIKIEKHISDEILSDLIDITDYTYKVKDTNISYAYSTILFNMNTKKCIFKSEILNPNLDSNKLNALFQIFPDTPHKKYKYIQCMYSKIIENSTNELVNLKKLLKEGENFSNINIILEKFSPIIPSYLYKYIDDIPKLYKLLPKFNRKVINLIRNKEASFLNKLTNKNIYPNIGKEKFIDIMTVIATITLEPGEVIQSNVITKAEAEAQAKAKAATKIQSVIRGKKNRKGVKNKKAEEEAQAKAQAKAEADAATKIQSVIRGKKNRKGVKNKKAEEEAQAKAQAKAEADAATKIQSVIRGKQLREGVKN